MYRSNIAALGAMGPALVLSVACAAASPQLRHHRGDYRLEVRVDGVSQPVYRHRGESYILGRLGRRYSLRVDNRSGRRVEAVVTVDGRDVLDGKPGNWHKRGYLIPAWGSVEIEGWRLSAAQVAAFRFSSVADSYASRTGSARQVGVIGVAIFPERERERPVYLPPQYDDSSDMEYRDYRENEPTGARKSAPAPSAKADKAPAEGSGRADETLRPGKRGQRLSAQRPGLATGFGERRDSPVREVHFVRAHPSRPSSLLGVRYNSHSGLIAMGVDLHQRRRRDDVALRRSANPFPAEYRSYAAPPPGWDD